MCNSDKTNQELFKENALLKQKIREMEHSELERKLTAESLRASEVKFKSIIATSQEWIWAINIEGRHTFSNPAIENILGYQPDEIIVTDPYHLVHEEDQATFKEIFRQSILHKKGWANLVLRWKHRDGTYRYLESNAVPIFNSTGVLEGFQGSDRDITKQKHSESALQESNALLSMFIKYSPIYAFIKDVTPIQSITLQASDNYQHMIGITGSEMIGKAMEELFPPEFAAKITKDDWKVVSDGCVLRLDEELNGRSYNTIKFPIIMGKKSFLAGYTIDTTDLKKAQETLQKNAELYKAVFENTGTATVIFEENDTISLVNTEFEKLTGYSKEETENKKRWMDFIETDDLGKMLTQHQLRIENPKSALKNYEFRLVNKAGETRHILLFVELITLTKQCVASIVDITERRRMEEALIEKEARLRTLSDNLHGGVVYQIDSGYDGKQRRFSYVSAGVKNLCGFSANEAMNDAMPLYEMVVEEDLQMLAEREQVALVNMSIFTAEIRIRIPSGEIKWVHLTSVPRRLPNHNLVWDGIGIEITERKKAEEELLIFMESVENSSDAVGMSTPEGTHYYQNRAFYELFGPVGDNLPDSLYVDSAVGHEVFRTIMAGEQWSGEVKMYARDRRILDILLRAYPNKDKSGRITALVGIHTDITYHKRVVEKRRELEDRLQRSEKMEALGMLAGGVAHDLNNTLGIIIGYSELLSDSMDVSSPLQSKVANIMKAGERAAAIVQDLLTLARRGVQTKSILNINSLVTNFLNSLEYERILSYNPKMQVDADLQADILNIMGSEIHIHKTIMNLVSNASEAMPNGGCLNVKTSNEYWDSGIHGHDEVREGEYVVLSISDSGEGISPNDIRHIFEPFYTKKVMGRSGTGLGLAVVWGTVKDHDGYIDVQSEEGKGTTFNLYFPVTWEEISDDKVSLSLSQYMGKGESVLVVDDVKGQRDLASEMLSKLNYTVTAFSSGEAAVEYLKANRMDILVLDMIMDPGMDGLDTYKEIIKMYPEQKAVIVSGFSETDRVNEAQRLGVGAYVKKPYVMERLGLAVRKELDRNR